MTPMATGSRWSDTLSACCVSRVATLSATRALARVGQCASSPRREFSSRRCPPMTYRLPVSPHPAMWLAARGVSAMPTIVSTTTKPSVTRLAAPSRLMPR